MRHTRKRSPLVRPFSQLMLIVLGLTLAPVSGFAQDESAPAAEPTHITRELHIVVSVDADQKWEKEDPEHPGRQWSVATTKHRYEIKTRLRAAKRLEVRNLLDLDQDARLEAKTIYLARSAQRAALD
jgi:hypothetical protein